MKNFFPLFLIAFLFVAGCQPSENAVNTAAAQTQAAIPTATATPVPVYGADEYMLEIAPLYMAYNDAYKVLFVYLQTATADPAPSWTEGYVNAANDLQTAADKLSGLTPPVKEVETLDQLAKRLSRETAALIDHLNGFYLEGNLDEGDLALSSVENIKKLFLLMNDEIEKNM